MGKFGSLSSSSSSSDKAPPFKPSAYTAHGAERMIVSGTTGKAWKPVAMAPASSQKRGGKKPPPADDQQPDKASTDVSESSSSSESENDQDLLRKILHDESTSHQTTDDENEPNLTESMKMRAILYGSPGDNQSNSSGWDSGAEGGGENSDNSQSHSHSRSRSSRSSASRSPSPSSRSGSSRSPSRSSRSPSNGESRSRTHSGGSQSRSRSSRSHASRSQSRSRSSRSRSPSSSRSPSDPPESQSSQLLQADTTHSEKESIPSHSGSRDKSSGSTAQHSIVVESSSGSKTSRTGSDPPESPLQAQPSPSQRSRLSARPHPWSPSPSKSNRSTPSSKSGKEKSPDNTPSSGESNRAVSPTKQVDEGKVNDTTPESHSAQQNEPALADSREFNDSSKEMSVLQRMEERRRTQAMQDSAKKLEADFATEQTAVDDTVTEKEVTQRSSPRRGQKPVVNMEASTPPAVENDGSNEEQAIDEAAAGNSSTPLNDEANPLEEDGKGKEKADDLHKVIVHDNDDWKPPALTTYGEVRYIPTHEYEERRDPDAVEPPAAPVAPIKDEDTPPKKSKKAKKDAPPPIPEITVVPSDDDDSTLGLHGEFLDRFPKKNKVKATERAVVSTPAFTTVSNEVSQSQPKSILQSTPQPVPQPTSQPALQQYQAYPEPTYQPIPQPQPAPQPAPILKSAMKETPSEYDKYKSWVEENIARPKETEAMDDYYKTWIRPESAGDRKNDRSDPPADVNLFPFNPVNPLAAKTATDDSVDTALRNSPMHASVNRSALRTPTWVPQAKKESDAGDSIPSIPQQYFKSERSVNSTWAAPGNAKGGKNYDHETESRRMYIESIIAKKRPYSRPQQTARVDFTGAVTSPSSSKSSSYTTSRSSSYSSSQSSSRSSTSTESAFRAASLNARRMLPRAPNLGKNDDSSASHSVQVEDNSGSSHSIVVEDSSPAISRGDSGSSGSSHDIEVVDDSASKMPAIAPSHRDQPSNPSRADYGWPSSSQNEPKKELAGSPMSRNRAIFLALFCLVALAGIGVVVYFFVVPLFQQDENQPSPTPAPTPRSTVDTSLEGLQDLIIEESPQTEAAFADPASPQSLALDWLAANSFLASYSRDQVLQRFVMATWYFSTGGESWTRDDLWLSNVDECEWYSSETEIQVCRPNGKLDELDLKRNNLVGPLPWNELAIFKDQLVILDVFSNQVSGPISSAVGELTSLRALDLQDNSISGTMPRALRRLTDMRHLILADNSINGRIPTVLSQMTELVTLNLRRNALTGSIPSTLGELSNLRNLLLDGNNLVGTIPEELCQMDLEKLVVDCESVSCDCCMCGGGSAPSPTLPTPPTPRIPTPAPVQNPTGSPPSVSPPSAGTPTSQTNLLNLILEAFPNSEEALQDLNSAQSRAFAWLESPANNGVSSEEQFLQRYALAVLYYASGGDGWINNNAWLTNADECTWWSNAPDVCDSAGRYIAVDLAENNLQGSLPAELAGLSTSMRQLSLFRNSLSGTLISEVGQLTRLESLDVGGNQLTGTLPASLGQMERLAGLSIYGNQFTGVLPSSLGDLDNLQLLYADSNGLRGPFPTDVCLLNLQQFWSDCEEIQCVCCTTCCSDGFGCVET